MSALTRRAISPEVFITAVLPGLFVFLWATGFIGSRLGAPHVEPFTFLAIRHAAAAVIMIAIVVALNSFRTLSPTGILHAVVVGLLVHGLYLGGIFWAIDRGTPAGVASLISALHPLLTGLAAGPILRERVNLQQWVGLLLGFAGVTLVVQDTLGLQVTVLVGIAACFAAVAGLTAGTIWQKRFSAGDNLLANQAVQLIAGALAMLGLSFMLETRAVDWTADFIIALVWLTCVMSVGAFTLLYYLTRRGAVTRVAGLFFLVPPVTAVIAYLMFEESLGWIALGGMAVAVCGVILATRASRAQATVGAEPATIIKPRDGNEQRNPALGQRY